MQDEYNLYFDDEYKGTFTEAELAKQFNISPEQVKEIADSKEAYKNEWRISAIYNARKVYTDKKTRSLLDEWDRMTEPYRKQRITG